MTQTAMLAIESRMRRAQPSNSKRLENVLGREDGVVAIHAHTPAW